MATVKYTLQASKDLEEIAEYISHDSQYYAGLQIIRILERVKQLHSNQNIGRVVPEAGIKSVRELIEGNYRIIYRIINTHTIHILTVFHSKRNLTSSIVKNIIKKSK
ncbi:MAG: type II toxin-antitoxin system RelE/ParE family toxin [Bacteroidota bacterium]